MTPVPSTREFLGSLNTIQTLVESTCEDKWEVLIQTALPAAGDALYILFTPDPGEIIENYLQPRGRRGDAKRARRGYGTRLATRYGALRWFQRVGIPDIDAIIGHKLPGRDFFRGRQAGGIERAFWWSIDRVDRLLWYWMLLDLSGNFVVEWASGIMESRFCTNSFDAMFSASGTIQPDATTQPFWVAANEINIVRNRGWQVLSNGTIRRFDESTPVKGTVVASITGHLESEMSGRTVDFNLFIADRDEIVALEKARDIPEGGAFTLTAAYQADELFEINVGLQAIGAPANITQRNWELTALLDKVP